MVEFENTKGLGQYAGSKAGGCMWQGALVHQKVDPGGEDQLHQVMVPAHAMEGNLCRPCACGEVLEGWEGTETRRIRRM